MSSAEEELATCLLQKLSKASLRALWKRELLAKQLLTYCRYLSCSSMTELTYCVSAAVPLSLVGLPAHQDSKIRKFETKQVVDGDRLLGLSVSYGLSGLCHSQEGSFQGGLKEVEA